MYKRKLRKHRSKLRQLADKSVPLSAKTPVVQRGGFLLTLLMLCYQQLRMSYFDLVTNNEDCKFMVGDFNLCVDVASDITIPGRRFKRSRGLWELLTRKIVKVDITTIEDLKRCKNFLVMIDGIRSSRRHSDLLQTQVCKVISELFRQTWRRGFKAALRQQWVTY